MTTTPPAGWVAWKPGDAMPVEGEYFTMVHPHFATKPYRITVTVLGGECAQSNLAAWRNLDVIAYWSEPLPPPYEPANTPSGEER